jgi:4-amino-4-deoxy-L-arabinose transferase-like glycosyltransferase
MNATQISNSRQLNKIYIVYIILAVLLMINLTHRLWLASHSFYTDDHGLSILAAKGITEHGLPEFRSGKLYLRSLLGHYLMAVPIYLFGINDFSTRSVSLLLSLLLLVLVYKIGRDLHNSFTGLLAVFFLTFNRVENSYAISPRFYMTFEFFFTLTLFLFYKGFIEEEKRYKWYCIFSLLATIFSHRLALELIPIALLALFIFRRGAWLKDKPLLIGTVLAGAAYWFVIFYKSPQMFTPFADTAWGGLKTGAMQGKLWYFNLLDQLNPNSLPIVILGALYVIFEHNRKAFFYYIAFGAGIVTVSLISPSGNFRYISNFIPLYIILLSFSLTKLIASIYSNLRDFLNKSFFKNTIFASLILLSFSAFFYRFIEIGSFFSFGYPERRVKETYAFVKNQIKQDDILISNNPWVAEIYIRAPDYFLCQRHIDNQWVAWNFEVDNIGYGYRLLGSISGLQNIMRLNDRRIWVLVDESKIKLFTGTEVIDFIKQNFSLVYDPDIVKVYLLNRKGLS